MGSHILFWRGYIYLFLNFNRRLIMIYWLFPLLNEIFWCPYLINFIQAGYKIICGWCSIEKSLFLCLMIPFHDMQILKFTLFKKKTICFWHRWQISSETFLDDSWISDGRQCSHRSVCFFMFPVRLWMEAIVRDRIQSDTGIFRSVSKSPFLL